LPEAFGGLLTDSASTSTLIALAAAREAAGLDAAAIGWPGSGPPVLAADLRLGGGHSSVEKACMTWASAARRE